MPPKLCGSGGSSLPRGKFLKRVKAGAKPTRTSSKRSITLNTMPRRAAFDAPHAGSPWRAQYVFVRATRRRADHSAVEFSPGDPHGHDRCRPGYRKLRDLKPAEQLQFSAPNCWKSSAPPGYPKARVTFSTAAATSRSSRAPLRNTSDRIHRIARSRSRHSCAPHTQHSRGSNTSNA